jgi:type VII secretion integral membrane protein EccD
VSVCRFSIQTNRDGGVRTVDVAVCAQTPVAALLPAVNDAAQLWPPSDDGRWWRLDRIMGAPIDDSMSLEANGIHDGELLVLTAAHTPLPPSDCEPARAVALAGDLPRDRDDRLMDTVCLWAMLVAAATLAWSGVTTHGAAHLIVAACGACVACWAGWQGRHATLPAAGATLAAVAGFLAVPSGPAAPNVFLAATAAFAVAVVMARLSERATPTLTATAAGSALLAASMAGATFFALPVATIGVTLATGALGLLALAPKAAILLSGLNNGRDAAIRADDGHATLTGLVVGSVAAVVVGTVLVALGCIRAEPSAAAGVAYTGVAGMVMLLRSRTYVDTARSRPLALGGLLSTTAAFTIVAKAAPQHACWLAAALCVFGLTLLRHRGLTPASRRAVELVDYVALAAVVPLACWVVGGYALARGFQLS